MRDTMISRNRENVCLSRFAQGLGSRIVLGMGSRAHSDRDRTETAETVPVYVPFQWNTGSLWANRYFQSIQVDLNAALGLALFRVRLTDHKRRNLGFEIHVELFRTVFK